MITNAITRRIIFLRKKIRRKKIFKISLNGGFSCPNIDGTKGVGGCTYCSSKGSGDFAGDPRLNVTEQFNIIKEQMETKWKGKYIAYFQANTNTYAPLSKLKSLYESALSQENVVGLSIQQGQIVFLTMLLNIFASLIKGPISQLNWDFRLFITKLLKISRCVAMMILLRDITN